VTGWINQNETSISLAKGEAIRQVKIALQSADVTIVDSSQVIVLDRSKVADKVAQDAAETTTVTGVEAAEDDALLGMIAAERKDEAAEDLLRDDAQKE